MTEEKEEKVKIIAFVPRIECPHCFVTSAYGIAGFGGQVTTRHKNCKSCGKYFEVEIIVTTRK